MKYIVLDTETTGLLNPFGSDVNKQPRITEIAAIKLNDDLEEIERLDQLINPEIPIPEEITKITNITDKMVKDKPTFAAYFNVFSSFCFGVDYFVAHNASFDQSIIFYNLMRINKHMCFPWPPNVYCTIEQSRHIEGNRLKLAELYKIATGKEIIGAHRAMNDVEATVDCFRYLINAEKTEEKSIKKSGKLKKKKEFKLIEEKKLKGKKKTKDKSKEKKNKDKDK